MKQHENDPTGRPSHGESIRFVPGDWPMELRNEDLGFASFGRRWSFLELPPDGVLELV